MTTNETNMKIAVALEKIQKAVDALWEQRVAVTNCTANTMTPPELDVTEAPASGAKIFSKNSVHGKTHYRASFLGCVLRWIEIKNESGDVAL